MALEVPYANLHAARIRANVLAIGTPFLELGANGLVEGLPYALELGQHPLPLLGEDQRECDGHRRQGRLGVKRQAGDDLPPSWRRDAAARHAVAEVACRDKVRGVDARGQRGTRSQRQVGKVVVDRRDDAPGVAALALADDVLDGELAPEVEGHRARAVATELADPARALVNRPAVAEGLQIGRRLRGRDRPPPPAAVGPMWSCIEPTLAAHNGKAAGTGPRVAVRGTVSPMAWRGVPAHDPQGGHWQGYEWADWLPLPVVSGRIVPHCQGVYRVRALRRPGLLYIGITGSVANRLNSLRRAVAAGTGRGHIAGRAISAVGRPVEVSWTELPVSVVERREVFGIEAELIAACRAVMQASPVCQWSGAKLD